MDKHFKTAAYNGAPVPAGLDDTETLLYVLLRAIYTAYKAGALPLEEGIGLKDSLYRYHALPIQAKIALLQVGFTLTTAQAGGGDIAALEASKIIARAFHKLTIGKFKEYKYDMSIN